MATQLAFVAGFGALWYWSKPPVQRPTLALQQGSASLACVAKARKPVLFDFWNREAAQSEAAQRKYAQVHIDTPDTSSGKFNNQAAPLSLNNPVNLSPK